VTWEDLDLATLEAEAMLLGNWKNFEELETEISLEELNLIVRAGREKERRDHEFAAALKGIRLDEGPSAKEKVNELWEKAQRKIHGQPDALSEAEEFASFGISFEED
jgi:hypothetical protein